MSISALELRSGMSVFGTDGGHVGRVKQIRAADFLIDRRFRRDVFVPLVAIRRILSEEHAPSLFVALEVAANKADRLGWPQPRQLIRRPVWQSEPPMAPEREPGPRELAGQRLPIGRSAAGVPRTYRLVQSTSWVRRLAVRLKRMLP